MNAQGRRLTLILLLVAQSGCLTLPPEDGLLPSASPTSTLGPSAQPSLTPTPTQNPNLSPTPTRSPTPSPTPTSGGTGNTCGEASEGGTVTLSCPSGQMITQVDFASYGTPNGVCGNFSTSTCHSSNSTSIVSARCISQTQCTIQADNTVFSDPCSGVFKSLKIQVRCGNSGPFPTATPTPTQTPQGNCPTPPGGIQTARYYVATNGSDSNAGTFCAPFKSWEKLASVISAGDRAYIRGGVYRSINKNGSNSTPLMNWENLNGNSNAKIEIFAYPGERPVLDLGDITPTDFSVGFQIKNSSYVHIKGLRVTGLRQPSPVGEAASGFVVDNTRNSKFEQIEVDHIGGYGFRFVNGSNDNHILNSDAHHLDDRYTPGGRAWQGANGFNITGGDTSTRLLIEGCRAWCVSDDGYDFYSVDAVVTIKNSWAFWNGFECTGGLFETDSRTPRGDGMGFKLGPANSNQSNTVLRTLTHNLAFENRFMGYDQNSGQMRYIFYNNTSYKHDGAWNNNQGFGYFFGTYPSIQQIFQNNLSYKDRTSAYGTEIQGSFNSWNSNYNLQDSHFMSLNPIESNTKRVDGPREADGSLPQLLFLKPAPGSPLINSGTNVNLPFNGSAPDIGAYEGP